MASIADRCSNFYINDEDIGNKTRAEASIVQLRELNPNVQTSVLSTEFTPEMVANYDVIAITENFWHTDRLVAINEACRANRVGFILSENLGLASYAFLDYGTDHVITDKNGETTRQFIVIGVEQGVDPVVQLHEETRHSYDDGDFVKFFEVEGMTELNNLQGGSVEIFDCKATSFRIKLDTSSFGEY